MMRIGILLTVLVMLCACQPLHVTKLYYDEYINPKASIDYQAQENVAIPTEVLDAFVRMDGVVVRVADALAKVESFPDDMWLAAVGGSFPEVRQWMVLDRYFLAKNGVLLSEDRPIQSFAEQVGGQAYALGAVVLPEGVALVRKFTDGAGEEGFVAAVLDPALVHQSPWSAVVVGDQVAYGALGAEALQQLVQDLQRSKAFSGSRPVAGTQYRWLMSARDHMRIAYVYQQK
ncbi:MAG: hypothetical protein WHT64_03950 [Desulfomicrobiaceae bacterium]